MGTKQGKEGEKGDRFFAIIVLSSMADGFFLFFSFLLFFTILLKVD